MDSSTISQAIRFIQHGMELLEAIDISLERIADALEGESESLEKSFEPPKEEKVSTEEPEYWRKSHNSFLAGLPTIGMRPLSVQEIEAIDQRMERYVAYRSQAILAHNSKDEQWYREAYNGLKRRLKNEERVYANYRN